MNTNGSQGNGFYLRRKKRVNGKKSGNAHAASNGQKKPNKQVDARKKHDAEIRDRRRERKLAIDAVLMKMRKAETRKDWEEIAALISVQRLYLAKDVITPLLLHCPDDHIRRAVLIRSISIGTNEIGAAPQGKRFFLSHFLLDLTGDYRGVDHRYEEVREIIKRAWGENIPHEINGKIDYFERKHAYQAKSDGKQVRVRHKKKPHSHPIAHMTDEERHARNERAKERRHRHHAEKHK